MRKSYALLLRMIAIDFFIVFAMNKMGIKIASWFGNALGIFIFLLPIEILLFLLMRDENVSTTKRLCCRLTFWFIVACYLLSLNQALV